MKKFALAAAAGTFAVCTFSYSAQALTVYSEFFNDQSATGFNSGTLVGVGDPVGAKNDLTGWDNGAYYVIQNAHGWTFNGSLFYAVDNSGTNGALYVNEPNGIATTVVGLNNALTYSLSFDYWGDNRPASKGYDPNYVLYVSINGGPATAINNHDYDAGSLLVPWTVTLAGLTTDGLGNLTIAFFEGTNQEASPIVDNVVLDDGLSAVPLPASLPLFGTGLGVIGLLARRMKRKNF